MANLSPVLEQLEQERTRLRSQLTNLDNALSALNGNGSTRRGRMSAAESREASMVGTQGGLLSGDCRLPPLAPQLGSGERNETFGDSHRW